VCVYEKTHTTHTLSLSRATSGQGTHLERVLFALGVARGALVDVAFVRRRNNTLSKHDHKTVFVPPSGRFQYFVEFRKVMLT
jgi:hypothetical protein